MHDCSLGGVSGCSGGACLVALGRGVRGCSRGDVRGCSRGDVCGCSRGGGCAWLLPGGCMVALGGVHGCSGGHAWLLRGGGVRGFFDEIRSMSGRYASYWNAFLLIIIFSFRTTWLPLDKIMAICRVICPSRLMLICLCTWCDSTVGAKAWTRFFSSQTLFYVGLFANWLASRRQNWSKNFLATAREGNLFTGVFLSTGEGVSPPEQRPLPLGTRQEVISYIPLVLTSSGGHYSSP